MEYKYLYLFNKTYLWHFLLVCFFDHNNIKKKLLEIHLDKYHFLEIQPIKNILTISLGFSDYFKGIVFRGEIKLINFYKIFLIFYKRFKRIYFVFFIINLRYLWKWLYVKINLKSNITFWGKNRILFLGLLWDLLFYLIQNSIFIHKIILTLYYICQLRWI